MKIRFDQEGEIEAYGTEVEGTTFTGVLPEDFTRYSSLGKYKVKTDKNGEVSIVTNSSFVPPDDTEKLVQEARSLNPEQLSVFIDKLNRLRGSIEKGD